MSHSRFVNICLAIAKKMNGKNDFLMSLLSPSPLLIVQRSTYTHDRSSKEQLDSSDTTNMEMNELIAIA